MTASDLTAETALRERIRQEMADSLDEELELELDDHRLDASVDDAPDHTGGIILIKYWFSVTDEEQQFRFTMRIQDPLKQWKLSPMDVQARSRWEQYTKAKEAMLEHTHLPDSPWWIVDAVDKKRARLNCISHLLNQIPYQEVQHQPVLLPPRVHNPLSPGTDPTRDVRSVAFLNASLVRAAALARIFCNVGKGSLLAPDRRLEARECDSRGSGPAGRLH